ncbi:hypothetical protein FQR65_LT17966 [Abscondita terminalis]|nr:hypothetical protein FQR65_LT17966 [Abscondita terminalis]
MDNLTNIIITVHQINEDGSVTSYEYEQDFITQETISKTPVLTNKDPNLSMWNYPLDDKMILDYDQSESDENSTMLAKLNDTEDIRSNNSSSNINAAVANFNNCDVYLNNDDSNKSLMDNKSLNIPTMIRCQNCDTNFPTKYQYQRHQCAFNAEKVVLKADADIEDIDKGMRIKYDCATCGKQFVSKNNLERHQTSHDSTQENVCEHCNKQFVSDNRLRIHKENHCKKAGDISKFYRSDVTVWKCIKCHQVFATPLSATRHSEFCADTVKHDILSDVKHEETYNAHNWNQDVNQTVFKTHGENMNIEQASIKDENVVKVLTELLLQCEYCNRTYADRTFLLTHQRRHTTLVNYECVTCKETFDSYLSATKHWMTKCTDEANLFYLPKMTYCECCDRTFKSHEILYTHKIKKKHYTPKMHIAKDPSDNHLNDSALESKDGLVKLIQDVLTTMNSSINQSKNDENDADQANKENKPIKHTNNNNVVNIVDLKEDQAQGNNSQAPANAELEKKKRGRKRKWPKQETKTKRLSYNVDDGYKYQCERCILVFDTIVALELHREKEHASNFSCEECGQVVHSAKALVIHSRAHQSLKPYVCEQCGRSYSQTSHLWQHMRFHQGIKPFACPHEGCEARYTIRPDLKDHIRKVHTRERPFKCSVCGKSFLTGSVYYQHRLIHTNDRRYGCDICEKRFFRADALNNHRRIHTDERPYPCEICGREFRQKGDRNKHVRTQHAV